MATHKIPVTNNEMAESASATILLVFPREAKACTHSAWVPGNMTNWSKVRHHLFFLSDHPVPAVHPRNRTPLMAGGWAIVVGAEGQRGVWSKGR